MPLDQDFNDAVQSLIEYAGQMDMAASSGATLTPWFLGPVDKWSGDVATLADVNAAFPRDEVGADYADAYTNEGSIGQAAAASIQSDYLAAMERSVRLRHLSPVRAAAHAAARMAGHGSSYGNLDRVRNFALGLASIQPTTGGG